MCTLASAFLLTSASLVTPQPQQCARMTSANASIFRGRSADWANARKQLAIQLRAKLGACRSPIRAHFWAAGRAFGGKNFGDDVNIDLWRALTAGDAFSGRSTKVSAEGERTARVVGSVLLPNEHLENVVILGAGARFFSMPGGIFNGSIVAAVRGKLTARYVPVHTANDCEIGGVPVHVDGRFPALGDPALFVPLLVPSFFHVSGLGGNGLCVLPHAHDKTLLQWAKRSSASVTLIEHNQHPLAILEAIAVCDFVVSSSLHGAIFSDSIGIPSIVPMTSNEPFFKYLDYASGLDTGVPDALHNYRRMMVGAGTPLRNDTLDDAAALCRSGAVLPRISLEARIRMASRFIAAIPANCICQQWHGIPSSSN